ncbi:MAG: Sapep family Mn(2+)-dependent dipeptidase, partial [Firmicutes bacterium]|nr:Sapep family Mn(2+)-dependent dipeptidase [Bacillota bacterium]
VKIPSVVSMDSDVKPFGQGCIDALGHMLDKGKSLDYETHNYENYVGRISMDRNVPTEESIGIWAHLDVVPVGDNWKLNPFSGEVKDGLIIGRGVSDNKDAAIGAFFVMKAIDELGIKLKHNLMLYLGTNEETGMHDLDYFLEKKYPVPKFSIVPDIGWPGMLGQFGRIEFDLVSEEPVTDKIVSISAGPATNIIPNEASVVLKKSAGFDSSKITSDDYDVEETDEVIKITASGTGGHAAFPEGKCNALRLITKVLAENGCFEEKEQKIFELLTAVNDDFKGSALGIDGEDEYGYTVNSATMAEIKDGKLRVRNDCRFKVTGDFAEHVQNIKEKAQRVGMSLEVISHMNGSALDRDSDIVKLVEESYEKATGRKAKLEVSKGGTYAGKLPNALAAGISYWAEEFPDYIEEGHGWAHQPDEILYIKDFVEGVKLFATVLLGIDEMI